MTTTNSDYAADPIQVTLRPPSAKDGALVHQLVSLSPPLDSNSMYCNLLQCSHFANTSVAANPSDQTDGPLLGFISAYILPERNDTLFIWQVAVSPEARGLGLASDMLMHILKRPQCAQVNHLETTITESNQASWALFKSLAKKLDCKLERSVMFDRETHFANQHDTELLARLGPF